jgi:hypothetical protein
VITYDGPPGLGGLLVRVTLPLIPGIGSKKKKKKTAYEYLPARNASEWYNPCWEKSPWGLID